MEDLPKQALKANQATTDTNTEVNITSGKSKPISNATQDDLDLKAPLLSPKFSGTVGRRFKEMVNSANVDNTSALSKPISIATQDALDLKAPLLKPTCSGTVGGISKKMLI